MGADKGDAGEDTKEEHHPVPPAQHRPTLVGASGRKHFTLVESAHGGGAVANPQLTPSEAKEARGAHKEELKHTHDKGLANLSNAAVKGEGSNPPRHQLMDDRRAHYGQHQSARGQS